MVTALGGLGAGSQAIGILGLCCFMAAVVYGVMSGAAGEEAEQIAEKQKGSRPSSRPPSNAGDLKKKQKERDELIQQQSHYVQAKLAEVAELEAQLQLERLRNAQMEGNYAQQVNQWQQTFALQQQQRRLLHSIRNHHTLRENSNESNHHSPCLEQ